MLGRKRGFRIGRKLVKVLRWLTRPRRSRNRNSPCRRSLRGSRILRLGSYLTRRAKTLCSFRPAGGGYVRAGRGNPVAGNDIPKGHLAVYVGQSAEESYRVIVPVIYINHPLFGELLREAENVRGHDHPGGITLPCGISELERVQTRIAEGCRCSQRDGCRGRRWRDWSRCGGVSDVRCSPSQLFVRILDLFAVTWHVWIFRNNIYIYF